MNSSRFSSVSCNLGIGKGFLRFCWYIFLKSDKNRTIPLFFGWIKVGALHSDLFTFFSTPNWYNSSTILLNTVLCTLGTGWNFAWYGLAPSCNFISTGLVLHLPNVLLNRNLYLDNNLCNTSRSSSVDFCYLMLPYVGHMFLVSVQYMQCTSCAVYYMFSLPQVFMSKSLLMRVCIWRHGCNVFHRGYTSFVCASVSLNLYHQKT